jgi:hypothetical protein
MSNTSDSLEIQATLDKLIAHELTSFEDDSVTTLRYYAFYRNSAIESIKLPNCTTIDNNAFQYCTALTTLDLSQNISVSGNWCGGEGKNLTHLILRSATLCPLSSTFSSSFRGTKIGGGMGAIYVPSNLVDTYKSATNWSAAASQIYALEDYPVTDFSTIKDDWDTIIAKLGNGTATYTVGDTKSMDYDGTPVYMQLVALEADDLADGSGKAKSTWISKPILETYKMNSTATTSGGWAVCGMRTYLRDMVINKIPSNIRSAIKEVTKTYKDYNDGVQSVADTVWIPSSREILGGTTYEDSGAIYNGVFNSSTTRIKYDATGSAQNWWLRSAHSASNFRYVVNSGNESYYDANSSRGLVLGFCI